MILTSMWGCLLIRPKFFELKRKTNKIGIIIYDYFSRMVLAQKTRLEILC